MDTETLYVDSREKDEKIFHTLDKLGIVYEKIALPIGDFVQGNICIERKTMADFIGSLRMGHLQKQLLQMEANYEKCFLIISGNFNSMVGSPYFRTLTVEHYVGSLAHLVRYPKLKVFQVDNTSQLVKLVLKIFDKASDGKVVTIADTELMKNKVNEEDVSLCMMCGIPGIGLKQAQKLRESGVKIALLNKNNEFCIEDDFITIDGFGFATAEKLLKVNESARETKEEENSEVPAVLEPSEAQNGLQNGP